jgi:hypothetical protein
MRGRALTQITGGATHTLHAALEAYSRLGPELPRSVVCARASAVRPKVGRATEPHTHTHLPMANISPASAHRRPNCCPLAVWSGERGTAREGGSGTESSPPPPPTQKMPIYVMWAAEGDLLGEGRGAVSLHLSTFALAALPLQLAERYSNTPAVLLQTIILVPIPPPAPIVTGCTAGAQQVGGGAGQRSAWAEQKIWNLCCSWRSGGDVMHCFLVDLNPRCCCQ